MSSPKSTFSSPEACRDTLHTVGKVKNLSQDELFALSGVPRQDSTEVKERRASRTLAMMLLCASVRVGYLDGPSWSELSRGKRVTVRG